MSNEYPSLAQTLHQYVQRSGYSVSRLARLTSIPHPTIVNWLGGRVKKPRYWDALVRLAAVLGLNEQEASTLLQSAGHPSIKELLTHITGKQDKGLLAPWMKKTDENHPAPFQAIADLPYFVAREGILQAIKQAVLNEDSIPICSLQGMAGAGKTSLAARAAYLLSPYFADGVLWARVDLSDTMSILSTFAAAYDRDVRQYSDVASRSQIVRMLLADKQALIVLDNVQRSEEVRPLIPATGSCAVIITTRRHDLAVSRGIHRFIVGPFDVEGEESMLLFEQLLGQEWVQREGQELAKIADLVGHLPLAIAIVAGRLAYEHNWSATQFIKRLHQEKIRLNELSYEDQDVALSFELSYEILPLEQQNFFAALSVFGGEDFSVDAAANITQLSEETAHDNLRKLHGMSLVQPGQQQRYRLHPLLRDYARKKLQDDSFEEAMIDYFVEFTQKNRLETAVMRRERGNIEYALKLACDKGKFTAFIRGVNAYYRFLLATGSVVVAEDYLRKAQEVGQHIDDQSIIAVSTHYLGQVREKQGDFIQAENYFQQALQLAQQAEAIEVMGGVLVNLGVLSARQGKSDEAERYWNQALDYAGQGQEHENVCAILSNLGALATIRGDYSKAQLYYEQGLTTATKWRHEHRMPSLFINLGNLLQKQGDIIQAKELYEKALALSRKLEYVFETSVSLQHLGELAQDAGDYSQAQEFYEESLKLAQQSHLKSRMSQVLASLGEALWLGGDMEQGTTRLSEGLILARSIEGANNHMTISILNKWGRLQLETGNLETAQEAFTEALAIATEVGSQESMAMSLFGLSKVDLKNGNIAAAQEKSRQSFEILSKLGHIEAAKVQEWREALQMEQVTSQDGTRIGFKRSGAGRPLVLVHGTTADHRRWSAVIPRFEEHFTVYAIDRRGRGASGDGYEYHILREAEDVAAVVDSISEPVFLLGHSYGAVCSLEASLLSDNIGRLILYEPPIPTGLPMYPPGLPDKIQALTDSGEWEAALELFFQEVVRMPEQELEAFRRLEMWAARIQLVPTLAREMSIDQSYAFKAEKFANHQIPTLLLLGGDSPPLFQQAIEVLEAALPNSRTAVLPGQQHIAMDTSPELFVQQVLDFLK